MKHYCSRCRMTFEVGKGPRYNTEITHCSQRGCGLRYWHSQEYRTAPVRVGIEEKAA